MHTTTLASIQPYTHYVDPSNYPSLSKLRDAIQFLVFTESTTRKRRTKPSKFQLPEKRKKPVVVNDILLCVHTPVLSYIPVAVLESSKICRSSCACVRLRVGVNFSLTSPTTMCSVHAQRHRHHGGHE